MYWKIARSDVIEKSSGMLGSLYRKRSKGMKKKQGIITEKKPST